LPGQDAESRKRGRIEKRGNSLRVRVYAGDDPLTGRRVYRNETVRGTDRAAEKRAQKVLTRLLAEVDAQRAPASTVALSYVLAEWLRTAELEDTTRRRYVGYIDRTITPAIGDVAADRLTPRTLEMLYGELRRCRVRCDGRPLVAHRSDDAEHDCAKAKCRAHVCRPVGRRAVGVDRVEPRTGRPAPEAEGARADPPSAPDAARLLDAAFEMDDDWGTLVWLVMTTGIRRGEVCALRWPHVDLDGETIAIRRAYTLHKGVGVEKDTKTHAEAVAQRCESGGCGAPDPLGERGPQPLRGEIDSVSFGYTLTLPPRSTHRVSTADRTRRLRPTVVWPGPVVAARGSAGRPGVHCRHLVRPGPARGRGGRLGWVPRGCGGRVRAG
jgi:hypothetical protein